MRAPLGHRRISWRRASAPDAWALAYGDRAILAAVHIVSLADTVPTFGQIALRPVLAVGSAIPSASEVRDPRPAQLNA